MAKVNLLEGISLDEDRVEDWGWWTIEYLEGPHVGHTAKIEMAQHNCGAYDEEIVCSCGAKWQNAMNGCWQYGHQRDENGDDALAKYEVAEDKRPTPRARGITFPYIEYYLGLGHYKKIVDYNPDTGEVGFQGEYGFVPPGLVPDLEGIVGISNEQALRWGLRDVDNPLYPPIFVVEKGFYRSLRENKFGNVDVTWAIPLLQARSVLKIVEETLLKGEIPEWGYQQTRGKTYEEPWGMDLCIETASEAPGGTTEVRLTLTEVKLAQRKLEKIFPPDARGDAVANLLEIAEHIRQGKKYGIQELMDAAEKLVASQKKSEEVK